MSGESDFGQDVSPADVLDDGDGLVPVEVGPMRYRVIEGNGDGYRACLVDLSIWACGCGKNDNEEEAGRICEHVLTALWEFKRSGGWESIRDRERAEAIDGLADRVDDLDSLVEDLLGDVATVSTQVDDLSRTRSTDDRQDSTERQAPDRRETSGDSGRSDRRDDRGRAQDRRQGGQRGRATDGGRASRDDDPAPGSIRDQHGQSRQPSGQGQSRQPSGQGQSRNPDPDAIERACLAWLDDQGMTPANMRVEAVAQDRRVYMKPDGLSDAEFDDYRDLCRSTDSVEWHNDTKENSVPFGHSQALFGGP